MVGPNAGSAWGGEPLFLSLGLSFLRLFPSVLLPFHLFPVHPPLSTNVGERRACEESSNDQKALLLERIMRPTKDGHETENKAPNCDWRE